MRNPVMVVYETIKGREVRLDVFRTGKSYRAEWTCPSLFTSGGSNSYHSRIESAILCAKANAFGGITEA